MNKCNYCTLYQGECNPKSKECEKAFGRYLKQKLNYEKEINKEALKCIKSIIEDIQRSENSK